MKTTPARPLAFLPVITKARELDARVLLAIKLVDRGFRVVLGSNSYVNYRAFYARNGVYFSPLLVPAVERRFHALRARGHRIIAWDEEGLVYPDPDWYFANRVSGASARLADALIGWGRIPADDLAATLPEDAPPIHPLGNGRIDLLRPPYRALYDAEGAQLRKRFGRYVLVNTNFDMVNHADGPGGFRRRMLESGRISGPRDEAKFADWAVFRQAMYDAFLEGIPRLHDALSDVALVLRPHPSESPEPYRALAARLPRLMVEPPKGPVLPWIVGAEAIVHNSCTTAVEAFLLDVPSVAYQPDDVAAAMDSPLPNLLSRVGADWDAVANLLRGILETGGKDWMAPRQWEQAVAHIGGLEGDASVDALADLAARMVQGGGAPELNGPGFVRRVRREIGIAARRFGFLDGKVQDDKRRFGGLDRDELRDLVARLRIAGDATIAVDQIDPDVFLLEAAQ
ncbi:surface carbohydrate biosynthesis protein [Stakelama tenebrarum]|uniref:Surface carbohydrate biosynthesis protein n=1 Tax=Stakelama tenebrarum TaxID=2711215 RepID=A0A6G6Y3W6_9SPHN|nr:surface carbohydrate biosynthesis protein [Sphingosinithalassobacter tenebrarum]QIG79541.1 hypothetical protein G5C33_06890 [Sphingosinithalassobacter tenebrarum]